MSEVQRQHPPYGALTPSAEPDLPASRVDSVLDYYTQSDASRRTSSPRTLQASDVRQQYASLRSQDSGSGTMSRNNSYGSNTRSMAGQYWHKPAAASPPSHKRALISSGAYDALSMSNIPQARSHIVRRSAPGLATRLTYNEEDGTIDPRGSLLASDAGDFDAAHDLGATQTRRLTDSQLARSASLPMKHLFASEDQARHRMSDHYASLPSRKRFSTNGQMRRSASSSSTRYKYDGKDAKALREEQSRRVHTINNAPSGTPPWLDGFQPDPRLPAEQQLLPTIARKRAQERSSLDHHPTSHTTGRYGLEHDAIHAEGFPPSSTMSDAISTRSADQMPTKDDSPSSVSTIPLGQDPNLLMRPPPETSATKTPNFSRRSTTSPSKSQQPATVAAVPKHEHGNEDLISRPQQIAELPAPMGRSTQAELRDREHAVTRDEKAQKKAACCTIM